MTNSPEAVHLYVPLMKELGMSWKEIKETPRMELEGLLAANYEFSLLHSMDGYEAKDINEMAKNRPTIRSDWQRYLQKRRKYEELGEKGSFTPRVSDEERIESNVSELKSKLNLSS